MSFYESSESVKLDTVRAIESVPTVGEDGKPLRRVLPLTSAKDPTVGLYLGS